MAAITITKWTHKHLEAHISQAIGEAIATVRATLLSVGVPTVSVENVCAEEGRDMRQVLNNLRKDCLFMKRPIALVYVETLLASHCAIINACRAHGATEAVDLGLSTTARREFFNKFAEIDTRGFSDNHKSSVALYMAMFVEDGYAVDPESTTVMDDHKARLFEAI